MIALKLNLKTKLYLIGMPIGRTICLTQFLNEVKEASKELGLMQDQCKCGSIYLVVISSKCIIKTNYTPCGLTGKRFSVPKAFCIFTASIKLWCVNNGLSGNVSQTLLLSLCW